MLSGITITCFAASYAVALALELARLIVRAQIRTALMVGFVVAGLGAHAIYLCIQIRNDLPRGVPLASWYQWCLMAAWVLAAIYLIVSLRRPRAAVGLFMLPMVLGMVGLAYLLRGVAPFSENRALTVWIAIHGLALLIGTVVVLLGFVAGMMYLVQTYRLKQKRIPRQGFELPNLEWLQKMNERSLVISSCLLAIGLLSGIVLNLNRQLRLDNVPSVPWTDPVVWSSGILLLWLIAALLFNRLYRPARSGRKVAYLTVASFIFLGLALAMALMAQHASPQSGAASESAAAAAMDQGGER